MLKLLTVLAVVGVALSTQAGTICPKLLSTLHQKKTANVMLTFVGSNRKVVNSIETRIFTTRTERLSTLKASLEDHAKISQEEVQNLLNQKSVHFKSFWISNKIFIRGASLELVQELAKQKNVEEIREEIVIQLEDPEPQVKTPPGVLAEWGIERVQAEEAWRITNGSGVVISTIDTGVRYTHEALRDQYRADHGWLDPYNGGATPSDRQGHGTHTMGTIIGTHGIGVAPGAQWIACKGCSDSGGCSESALEECGEWTVCPYLPDGTDADCSKAPVLSSNSWGGSGGDHWYEAVTEAWIAGGIVPISSIGNSGTSCRTSGSPGDYRRVIGVGSINVRNELSYYSSVGPAADGRVKPEISAPGEDVRSSVPDSDSSYGSKSGTSMACPHAAGVTALLLSIEPNLTFGQVRQALLDGTDHNVSSDGSSCSGLDDSQWPNHHFGWGVINALKVVEAAAARKANKA